MKLYHVTTRAKALAILADGFTGVYGRDGLVVVARRIPEPEEQDGDTVLRVELPDDLVLSPPPPIIPLPPVLAGGQAAVAVPARLLQDHARLTLLEPPVRGLLELRAVLTDLAEQRLMSAQDAALEHEHDRRAAFRRAEEETP